MVMRDMEKRIKGGLIRRNEGESQKVHIVTYQLNENEYLKQTKTNQLISYTLAINTQMANVDPITQISVIYTSHISCLNTGVCMCVCLSAFVSVWPQF